ncbi:uncharacterized protein HKW66_Vig0147580 [Vigna angularis]|uniref:Uncharacterized protein n=1 Tax=Phaseolus angularis TaxID=3914 RepID=A0A8T0JV20_PHAAN|nr:uncharacterized protein HKW66_Vig0147580 [Vigna angularis]
MLLSAIAAECAVGKKRCTKLLRQELFHHLQPKPSRSTIPPQNPKPHVAPRILEAEPRMSTCGEELPEEGGGEAGLDDDGVASFWRLEIRDDLGDSRDAILLPGNDVVGVED